MSAKKSSGRRSGSKFISKVTDKISEMTREQQDKPKDAIALLKADHQEATELFERIEQAETAAQKKALVTEVCLALSVHMRIEEDIFYPAAKKALKGDEEGEDLVPEARVEHAGVKQLITEVESAAQGEEYDAKVQVMSEYIKHHVKEEENEMFPKVESAGLDLDDLGEQLLARKLELMNKAAGKGSRSSKAPKPSSLFGPGTPRAARGAASRPSRGNGSRQHARS